MTRFPMTRYFSLAVLMTLSLLLSGCSPDSTGKPKAAAAGESVKLQGAGASFPAPLYNKWFKAYNTAHPEVQIDYQSVGSGSGVKAVIDKTVDFGASDAAMSEKEIAQVDAGVLLLPMTAGSIVLAYNVAGVDDLKLSREAYVGIFLGTITKWDDPAIAATNPGAKLPSEDVHVVVRADSSGTTYVFTKHLATISPEFAKNPGVDKMPNWPTGTKSKGNEGVAASIRTTPGAIGYMEYGYALGAKLKAAKLENMAGEMVEANNASGAAALDSIEVPDDLVAWLPDPEGKGSYPIVTYTWIMTYKKYADAHKAETLKKVLTYCLTDGQSQSEAIGYIPLPKAVAEKVVAALSGIESEAAPQPAK